MPDDRDAGVGFRTPVPANDAPSPTDPDRTAANRAGGPRSGGRAGAPARIAAILRPGGVPRPLDPVYAYEPSTAGDAIEGWLAGATDDPARGWSGTEIGTPPRQEDRTFSWRLERRLEPAGTAIRDARDDPRRIHAVSARVKSR